MTTLYTRFVDVLTPEEWQVCTRTVEAGGWRYNSTSYGTEQIRFFNMNLDDEPFFARHFFNNVLRRFVGTGYRLDTVYANGQVHGLCGSLHCDDHSDNAYTFLYYANKHWEAQWGGGTVFCVDGRYETADFVPNTALFFKGNVPHVGLEPTRHCKELRTTIAFKLFKEQ